MKKIIIGIFSVLLMTLSASAQEFVTAFSPYTLSKNEILFGEAQRTISAIDPTILSNTKGTYFPGVRGTNQLIIYTPEFGEKTNTNEFGTEAIVEGNTVTSLSGADSYIPKNGFVISGHGTAQSWIKQNITVGTKIYVNQANNTLQTYLTSDSFIFEADRKIHEAREMIDYNKKYRSDYNGKVASEYVQQSMDYLKLAQKTPEAIQLYSKQAIDAANMAIRTALPYSQYETKGVWIRPTERSQSEIISTLDKLKNSGINTIFLETYFHGRTIYPSEVMKSYGFVSQNEKFIGFNPLEIWVNEAHKRGIKVHVWFETFYVGNKYPLSNSKNILAVHPEWGNRNKKFAEYNAPTQSVSEHNGYFLDPANPEVQEFLMALLVEIITVYKPDGVNLDYIRYPQSVANSDINSWGYTAFARKDFTDLYGVDPVNLSIKDELWGKWNDYRRDKVTNMVRKVGSLGNKNNVYVSTVIFPDRVTALNTKQQDWRVWSLRGYVNGFTPLLLTCDSTVANSMMREVINSKSAGTDLMVGLFVTFMSGSEEDLIRQIYETRKLGLKGIVFFDYAHLTPKYTDTLALSTFNPNPPVMKRSQDVRQAVAKSTAVKNSPKKKKGFWFFAKKDKK